MPLPQAVVKETGLSRRIISLGRKRNSQGLASTAAEEPPINEYTDTNHAKRARGNVAAKGTADAAGEEDDTTAAADDVMKVEAAGMKKE